MKNTTAIKDFYGKILGYIEEDEQGNKTIRDFYRKILGRYDKKLNITKDFYGRVLGQGDLSSGLIYRNTK